MLPTEPDQPDIRVSDAERNRVVDVLREHCSDGRLTLEEFSDRVGDVFAAKTRRELDTVLADLPADLPASLTGPTAPTAPQPQPAQHYPARRRSVRRWIVSIMGGGAAKGRWRPAEETNVLALMGGCEVDLRNAEIDGEEIVIRAYAVMGGIEVVVPEGIEVEMDGFAFMGGNERRIKPVPRLPGTPVVVVKAFSFMGGVVVKSKAIGERRPHQRVSELRDAALERALQMAAEAMNQRLPSPPQPPATAIPGTMPAPATPKLPPGAPGGTVTILFSDIEGFSAMTERLGDRKAQEIVRVHNSIVRGNVGACGGFEVKTAGDGFMIAFDSAARALRCATAVQHELNAYNRAHPDEPIKVRMGLHTGEAIRDNEDFLGRTVIVASRIADAACGGEILVSALLKELVAGTGEFRFGEPREVELKGLSGTHQVVPVAWAG